MPIYEFKCEGCQHEFEHLQKINDPSCPPCPNCQSIKVDRLVSASGFQLKGSGWYATDFKTKPQSPSKAELAPSATKEKKQND